MQLEAEVVVIGGGITGASLLHHLGVAGADAVLLERDTLAAGATGRNAGFLIAGVAENYATAVDIYGRALAAELWRFTRACHDELAEAVSDADVEYSRSGSWTAAGSPAEAAELERAAALMLDDGFEVAWREDIEELPPGYPGALLNPGDAEIHSAAAVLELVRSAAGRVEEGVDVTAIAPSGGGVTVDTGRGAIRAKRAIVATNAWASVLLPGIAINPIRGQALLTAPIDRRLVERPVYANRGFQYWRQRRDGRVVVGGWRDTALEAEVGFEARPTRALQADLDAHLKRMDIDAPVYRRWAGIMGFTPTTCRWSARCLVCPASSSVPATQATGWGSRSRRRNCSWRACTAERSCLPG